MHKRVHKIAQTIEKRKINSRNAEKKLQKR